jgi:CheY-specific phosphatase CheX
LASDVKDLFVNTFNEIFSYLDFDFKFLNEVPLSTLSNALQHNVLVGVNGSLCGNIMFSYSKKTFKALTSSMTGLKNLNDNDIFAVSSVVDLFSEFCKRLIKTFDNGDSILLASPISISGTDIRAMISQIPSRNLFFKVNDERLAIAFDLKENK